jgi:2-polyprenyl-3-methyl-5-hydroxy-6-metoxy-1,4-benzoquinol methylase
MVTTDMVKACYRAFFNRDPENAEVVRAKTKLPNLEALLLDFMSAPEYQINVRESVRPIIDQIYNDVSRHIDYEVSEEQLAACFARIRDEWTALGIEEPYWSVGTSEALKQKNLDNRALSAFFASGRATVSSLKNFLARNGREIPKGECLEFGCGTGRVTRYLAELFEHVRGVDISPGNLKLAGNNIRDAGLSNVSFMLLQSPEQLASVPTYDFLFSTIVLQHNPPPLQSFLLNKLLAKLRSGGAAFVQISTSTPGYSFKIDDYLKGNSPGVEMHDLPMRVVFERLDQHNMVPVEVLTDNWTGRFGSHTFFATKR